ncbi:MAG: SpoIIE family protein phosphatase [Gemmataceae bacterium]|nr:SpoIIE family protein phosphatase [Gemmataceae bacterium]
MATLLILKGTDQGRRMPLEDERTIMGRNRDCQVVIDFPAVSREHAQILKIGGKFYIEDRDSRNGTFVNNQQIAQRTLLKNNDRIKICDFLCTFHDGTVVKPLPIDLRPEEPEPTEEGESSSTVEARLTASGGSHHLLLESQPAEKIKALLDISTNLSKTLELDALLPKIAESLFQLFRQADRCFLILREESGKLVPKMIKTRRNLGDASARFSRSIVQQCLETGQAFLSEDATTDSRFGLSQSIADFRIRSVMCAPLLSAEGKAFGVIQLDTQDRTKKFMEDDLKLLVGVANQAAVALENVQMHNDLITRDRFQRDLELAREVQRGFLPGSLPQIPGYQFFAHYESAQQIGGDYYDFTPLSNHRLGILLGDVAGKGVPAALLMAKLSAEARFCMLTEPELAVAISRLNDLLMRAGMMDRFVTLAGALLDPGRHTVALVNAGHPPPQIYRAATSKLEDGISTEATGLPLGVLEDFTYSAHQVELRPGDSILMFTDGITDSMNAQNQPFQMAGIHAAVKDPRGGLTAPELGERVIKAVKQHAIGRSQHDDIAVVCFGRVK